MKKSCTLYLNVGWSSSIMPNNKRSICKKKKDRKKFTFFVEKPYIDCKHHAKDCVN